MYTPSRTSIYEYQYFSALTRVTVDVTAHGYPAEAVAVELLLGCRSWADGAYVAAYDGVTATADRIAVYPTALMRNQWAIARGRVELEGSSFLLNIRPKGDPIQVIAVLKGYHEA